MGASYIDYLIADPTVVPRESQAYYSEKIAYLPNSYQPNDRSRKLSEKILKQMSAGEMPTTVDLDMATDGSFSVAFQARNKRTLKTK